MQTSSGGSAKRYPLTPGQASHHARSRSAPEVSTSLSVTYRIDGELDVERFIEALDSTVARHDCLRIGLSEEDGRPPVQWARPAPGRAALIRCQQVRSSSEEQFTRYAKLVHRSDLAEPWDLSAGYPFRFRLLRHSPGLHAFLASFSHVALDGRGTALVLRDLWHAFEYGPTGPGAETMAPAASFVEAAERGTAGPHEASGAFWDQRISEARQFAPRQFAPRPAELPGDDQPSYTAAHATVTGAERSELRAYAKSFRATEVQVAIAALANAVFAETAEDHLHVWLPVDARTFGESDTSGMFTVSLPVSLRRTDGIAEMIRQVRNEVMSVAAHRQVDHATASAVSESFRERDGVRGWMLSTGYFNNDQNPGEKSVRGIVARPNGYPADTRYSSRGAELKVLGSTESLRVTLALGSRFAADPAARRIFDSFAADLGGVRLTW
ncbi:hypothetical protein CFP65_5744 [Kitasatospora sp. MMS16-BH015]|uniref:condensation domain-containing protein n=1 Tax=Kitasatospora sp. MMS16-BH015 TaxID=2018025 RepID=UPI000CA144A6|nr:condensation domain-containing protein [Kitasatospora sp. MMS16-BH015]AUG80431.1 hypothetical protein CFP65_5744 [Kitasatospora sp. MMS16-BH015]